MTERRIPKYMSRIRNLGIMAHIDAGKTTVTERLLYITGRIHKMGEVHDGEATMDWMVQEQERGITITSAVTSFDWANHEFHLIDTPGHVDFTIEVERSLRVLDGAVAVFDGVHGVESQTETVWHQANKYHVPRLAFVNKLDRIGADFWHAVETMHARLGKHCVPIQLPIGSEGSFRGCVDLVTLSGWEWQRDNPSESKVVPPPDPDAAQAAREALVERVADVDDALAEAWLEGQEIDVPMLKAALRRATIAGKIVPVLCGSALHNRGLPPLLDAIIDYLPSPADVPDVDGVTPGATPTPATRPPDDKAPLCALAYKVQLVEDGRRMVYLRIYSGTLRAGEDVFNASRGHDEKPSRIFLLHANQRTRTEKALAGQIVGVLGLKHTYTGDTVCVRSAPIVLERIGAYEPVISQTIEPETLRERDKLLEVLGKLGEEDPTFRMTEDKETGDTLISGMGELHLEIIADRVRREFGLPVRVGKPQVVFEETVTASASGEAEFEREQEDERLYGKVKVRVEPAERGAGISFRSEATDAFLTDKLVDLIREGALEGTKAGPLQGFPMNDVAIVLTGGTWREGWSQPIAYKIAASIAVRNATAEASPALLEPIMEAEVNVPEDCLGEVIGGINARRGRIEDIEDRGERKVVKARVPLQRMFGYSTEIRSLTQGRGVFAMHFAEYDRA